MTDYANHIKKEFIHDALADGWTLAPSPWGESESDRSVKLLKELPELEGYFNLWLVDRDMFDSYRDVAQYLWYCQRQEPYADRQNSLDTDQINFDKYDLDSMLSVANKCPVCGREVPANELNLVAFANAACDECLADERKRLETPGWSN